MCAGFVAANPYALLDHQAFRDGAREADRDRGRGRRQARPREHVGLALLPRRRSPGASAGCRRCSRSAASAALIARHRRLALAARAGADPAVPLPRRAVALLRALDAADLPDPVHARGLRRRSRSSSRLRVRAALAARRAVGARCSRQGLVFSVHNDLVLAARRHAPGGARLDGAEHPGGHEDRRRADRARPVGDGRRAAAVRVQGGPAAATAGTSGARRARASSTARRITSGRAPWSSSRTTSARRAPELVDVLREGRVLLGRHRLDPVRPRLRGPAGGPGRAALLRRAAQARRGRVPHQPVRRSRARAVLVRLLVQLLPADLRAAGAGDRDLPAPWRRLRAHEARLVAIAVVLRAARGSACRT